ncbi:MAG: exodeoxyribonuclease-3 [Lysobacterales bacterium]|jgi:exodeoxyribonuclease-3
MLKNSIILILMLAATSVCAETELKLLHFNVWGAGQNQGKSIEETLAVLRAIDADIVSLQESRAEAFECSGRSCPPRGPSAARELAEAMGYHYYDQKGEDVGLWANAILSRFPILEVTPNEFGIVIETGGKRILVISMHGEDYPYVPYQLLGIPYGDAPFLAGSDAAVESARQAKQAELELLLQDLSSVENIEATFVMGDFNEPSHRDWTAAAAAAGQHPFAVEFPFTVKLEELGFVDAYRTVFPDEIARPGYTWTPTTSPDDPADHHDRIDFIFVRGAQVLDAAIVGEKSPEAEIVVTPWPSDHRAVMAKILLP